MAALIYEIVRVMVWVAFRVFYKEYFVIGKEKLPRKGPLIIVANHPNTLMDPIIVASLLKQRAGFLGNGSLFRSKMLGKFLRYFNVIPVYRKQDIRPGENIDNEDSFRESNAYLANGGTLLIFPEGTSFSEKKLRELRTGAARIAFSFEAGQNFKGGMQMVPVAINYSAPTEFRSRVRIEVGNAIDIVAFEQTHRADPVEAVRALTRALEEGIAENLVILEDKSEEAMHNQIARLYQEDIAGDKANPKGKRALAAEMEIAAHIKRVKREAPERFEEIKEKLNGWFARLETYKLPDGFFRRRFQDWSSLALWSLQSLFLLLGLPFFLFGLLTSYLPYWFPQWLAPKMSDEIEYHAPIMMLVGMFLFPIWHWSLVLLAWLAFGITGWPLLGLALALPLCAALAWIYQEIFQRWKAVWRWMNLERLHPETVNKLKAERASLLQSLEALR